MTATSEQKTRKRNLEIRCLEKNTRYTSKQTLGAPHATISHTYTTDKNIQYKNALIHNRRL